MAITPNNSFLTKALLSLEVRWIANSSKSNALVFADGRSRHVYKHATAADCHHPISFSADTKHAGHRAAAHCNVCVDRRTQTHRTSKTSPRLAATHNDGCRPQPSQWSSATDGRSADGERIPGKVTRGNNLADWTVPTKWRWHCRHISFTAQLHSVCVERKGRQLKRDDWKSAWDSEIEHIVEPNR